LIKKIKRIKGKLIKDKILLLFALGKELDKDYTREENNHDKRLA